MLVKLEWLGYCMVKKLWRYVKPFSCDTGTLRTDRQMDGRTDRQTDGHICYINIARQYADARWKTDATVLRSILRAIITLCRPTLIIIALVHSAMDCGGSLSWTIPTHVESVAALPCEIRMFSCTILHSYHRHLNVRQKFTFKVIN